MGLEIERAAIRLKYDIPERVYLATLPTGLVNGRNWRMPIGNLWVAIDDGLFLYFYSLAKAVATFLPVEVLPEGWRLSVSPERFSRDFETNEDGHRRFLETILATFVLGHPAMAPSRPLILPKLPLVATLAFTAERFAVAHEYGHLILRHYDPDRPKTRRLLIEGTDIEVDEVDTSEQMELEADQIAVRLTRECHRDQGRSLAETRDGLYFLFACLDLIEQFHGQGPDHPPVEARLSNAFSQLDREEPPPRYSVLPQGHLFWHLMMKLWNHNKARFEEESERILDGELPWSFDVK